MIACRELTERRAVVPTNFGHQARESCRGSVDAVSNVQLYASGAFAISKFSGIRAGSWCFTWLGLLESAVTPERVVSSKFTTRLCKNLRGENVSGCNHLPHTRRLLPGKVVLAM